MIAKNMLVKKSLRTLVGLVCCSGLIPLISPVHAHAGNQIAPEAIEQQVQECAPLHFNAFNCARGIERKKVGTKQSTVSRVKESLRIRLATRTIKLVDSPSKHGDKSIAYSYLGFDKKLNLHIIHLQRDEGDEYMVIHHFSGQRALPSGYPLASPDGKNFLSISEDLFGGTRPNNIEIWKITKGRFSKDASFEPTWGPRMGQWQTPDLVRIAKHCYAPTEKNNAELRPCGEARVEYAQAHWKLIE